MSIAAPVPRPLFRSLALVAIAAALGCTMHRSYTVSNPVPEAASADIDDAAPTDADRNPPDKVFIVQEKPLSGEAARASFSVPPGFEVQLVASEPEIRKPMQLAFDEKGRLLVSTSTDYPLGAPPGREPADRVMLLEIDGETGRATRITALAEGFDICSGVESLPGGRAIIAQAPHVFLVHDKDGDGRSDTREVLFTGFGRSDTHEVLNSFTWGTDGWLYALQGHANTSDVTAKSGKKLMIAHGNCFRMRPDGGDIEIWTDGLANPWGLAFDDQQNLFGIDCETRPIWQLVAGCRYPGFNQPEDPLGFAPHVLDDHHGASGFAGLAYYDAKAYPEVYRGCLYLGGPLTNRVHRDRPEGPGSTRFMRRRPDFLVSSDPWFRPVDIELGPDGALYIADWYANIIAHVEVRLDHPERDKTHGRIWRVVYRGTAEERADAARAADIYRQFAGPMAIDWSSLSRTELLRALGHEQRLHRRMAAQQLEARFESSSLSHSLRRLAKNPRAATPQRVEAMWLLARFADLTHRDILPLLEDPDAIIRAQATRLAGAMSPNASDGAQIRSALVERLNDASPYVVREAALALCREPSMEHVRALLRASMRVRGDDPLLAHALRHAIREQLVDPRVVARLPAERLEAHDWALLTPILAAAPTAAAAAVLADRILAGEMMPDHLPSALENIVSHGEAPVIAEIFTAPSRFSALVESDAIAYARSMLKGARRCERLGVDLRPALTEAAQTLSKSNHALALATALEIGRSQRLTTMVPVARRAVEDRGWSVSDRRNAALLLVDVEPATAVPALLDRVRDSNEDLSARRMFAQELAGICNDDKHRAALLDAVRLAPADVAVGALEWLVRSREGLEFVVAYAESGHISPVQLATPNVIALVNAIHQSDPLVERLEALTRTVPPISRDDLRQVEQRRAAFNQRPAHDRRNGQLVFEKNCMICHRIGGVGGARAPSLDGLANRGLEQVLQDVITPSRDVDPAFRTTVVFTKGGGAYTGLLVEETADSVVIMDSEGAEQTFVRSEIDEMRQEWISAMPSGFGAIIPEPDFLDLVAFLLNPPSKMVRLTQP